MYSLAGGGGFWSVVDEVFFVAGCVARGMCMWWSVTSPAPLANEYTVTDDIFVAAILALQMAAILAAICSAFSALGPVSPVRHVI